MRVSTSHCSTTAVVSSTFLPREASQTQLAVEEDDKGTWSRAILCESSSSQLLCAQKHISSTINWKRASYRNWLDPWRGRVPSCSRTRQERRRKWSKRVNLSWLRRSSSWSPSRSTTFKTVPSPLSSISRTSQACCMISQRPTPQEAEMEGGMAKCMEESEVNLNKWFV